VFHLELRQFPHLARAFNLDRDELDAILVSWVAGQPVELDDRSWEPKRAKLTVYEAAQLASEEIGMGRGWATVARRGEDVTERRLAEVRQRSERPAPSATKDRLLERLAQGSLELPHVVELMAGEDSPRVSQRLAAAEQAVWELLHEGRVSLVREGRILPPSDWRTTLLSWSAWRTADAKAVSVERVRS
jgi:hypothetical protein